MDSICCASHVARRARDCPPYQRNQFMPSVRSLIDGFSKASSKLPSLPATPSRQLPHGRIGFGIFHVFSSPFMARESMHLAQLRLRDFRNYARLDAEFTPDFHLLLGDNAQ